MITWWYHVALNPSPFSNSWCTDSKVSCSFTGCVVILVGYTSIELARYLSMHLIISSIGEVVKHGLDWGIRLRVVRDCDLRGVTIVAILHPRIDISLFCVKSWLFSLVHWFWFVVMPRMNDVGLLPSIGGTCLVMGGLSWTISTY